MSKVITVYLVKATVQTSEYQGKTTEETDVRLVLARDETDACDKYLAYWKRKSDEYSTVYNPWNVEVLETIE